MFFDIKKGRKNIFGPLSRIGPQKIPSKPNPIPKVGPKGTHSEFWSGPKDQSFLVILYFSLCLCLCLSRYLYFPFFSLSVCQHRLRHFLQSCAPVFACGLTNACVGSSSAIKSQSSVPFASESHQTRWQQQLHQVRIELRITINSRIDQFNRIATAMQNLTTNAPSALSCRASDLIPNNWEGSVEKECTKYTAALHVWMQAWSDQGEKMPVSRKRRHDGQRQPVN